MHRTVHYLVCNAGSEIGSLSVGIEGSKLGEISTLSVTEKWLEQLKSLTSLERLKLQGCGRIDDAAVAALIAMPSLREVDLKGTAVTEKGLEMLRAAKPRAAVYIGPWEGKLPRTGITEPGR
jgi:hypothetical protein